MSTIAPTPEGTTGSLPIIAPARHRTDHQPVTPIPAWLQLVSTVIAVAVGWFAILEWRDPAAPLLMGVALLIAGAALALDVTAALSARRNMDGAE